MANLFTSTVTYGGKDSLEAFIRPAVIAADLYTLTGVRIIQNVQSNMKLQVFGGHQKLVKAYAKGFSGVSGATHTTKTLNVYPMQAEWAQDADQFRQTAYEVVLNKGAAWNDLTGTPLLNIITEIVAAQVKLDIFRQYWLNDTLKETVTSGVFTGTADTDYNAYDGIWKQLMAVASATPTAGTHVKRVAFAHGSVAQVTTLSSITFPTAGGDIVVRVMGKDYTETYDTDLATTITAFVATNAAALALRGVTLTGTSTTIVFTSAIAGKAFGTITIPSASDTLTCTVTATTPNTNPSALTSDEAYTAMEALRTGSSMVLRQMPPSEKVMLVTYDVYDNYLQTLQEDGKYTELAKMMIINGMQTLSFNGIPVIPMPWDAFLADDFSNAYPSRIVYTAKQNLIVGVDTVDEAMSSEFWYNRDEQENRFRLQFKIGALFMHPDLTAVAY